VLWLFDGSKSTWKANLTKDRSTLKNHYHLFLFNKLDLVKKPKEAMGSFGAAGKMVGISSLTGAGLAELRKRIVQSIGVHLSDASSGQMVTSERHRQKLSVALKEIKNGRSKLTGSAAELVAFHLRQAAVALEEITGKVYTEEILGKIFASFCIGK
jgi:tRNA modification GTPase